MPELTRRAFVNALAGAAGLLAPGAWAAGRDRRPNFLIMIADDVGGEDIGGYGHPTLRTPHIDALARDGLKFRRAFLPISSCSPSRCAIMTGRYPHATGAGWLHAPLPADQNVFAGRLREAGYYAGAAGKWHLGKPCEANFDTVLGTGHPSGCGNWVKLLADRPRDRPFCLWLAAVDAHRAFDADALPEPYRPEDAVVPPYLPDTPEVRRDLAAYYNEIGRLDGYVGRVLAELDRQGEAERTVVIFLSDNGRPFPRCKTTLYDSGIQTPLCVRWPERLPAGGVVDGLVSSIDLAPTLLELAGVAIPATVQGRSLTPLLKDPTARVREHIFAERNWHDYQAHDRAVRDERWLYLRNRYLELNNTPPADAVGSPTYQAMVRLERAGALPAAQRQCFAVPRPAEELYDTLADPHQLYNLAADPAYATIRRRLAAALDRWARETDDREPAEPRPDGFDRWTGKKLPA